jgi:cell division protein FtsQ
MELAAGVDHALVMRRRALAKTKGRRRLAVLLATIGLVAGLLGYRVLRTSSVFAVTAIEVHGGDRGLDLQVEAAVSKEVAGKSLLQVDASRIGQSLASMPYVRSVHVDRAFPHTLSVSVDVYRPAAYARVGKEGYLIASDGRVLGTAVKQPKHVPLVWLPTGSTLLIGKTSGDDNVRAALGVLASVPPGFRTQVGPIVRLVPSAGMVTAVIGKRNIRLRLGTPDQLPVKLAVAARVMRRIGSAQRANIAFLDVSVPSRPALGLRSS